MLVVWRGYCLLYDGEDEEKKGYYQRCGEREEERGRGSEFLLLIYLGGEAELGPKGLDGRQAGFGRRTADGRRWNGQGWKSGSPVRSGVQGVRNGDTFS